MGLDMYAFITTGEFETDADFDHDRDASSIIYQWRKHPNLHGWMERLYRAKGGTAKEFYCVTVKLSMADLMALEADVVARRLPETSGLFFGRSFKTERDSDLRFIRIAMNAIDNGLTVYYWSWW